MRPKSVFLKKSIKVIALKRESVNWISLFGQHNIGCLPIQCWFKIYIYSALFVSTPGQISLKFWGLLQEGKHLLEICCQMNKGICFNKIIIFRQYCIGQWPIFNAGLFHVCSLFSSMERKKVSFRKNNVVEQFLTK